MHNIVTPKVTKIWMTPDARRVVAFAGRVCYSGTAPDKLFEQLTNETVDKMVVQLLEKRHTSVFRHASLMVAVSGVSRAFSHQLVRHTVGHAYEQRSQHYRTEKDFDVVRPLSTPLDDEDELMEFYANAQTLYDKLIADGMPKEDARMILPNGIETVLVWTMNLEAAMNFCKARCCRLNNYEIISVAAQVRKIIIKEFPEMKNYLGPTCWTQGLCFEAERYHEQCNRPWKTAVLWHPDFPKEIELIGKKESKNE